MYETDEVFARVNRPWVGLNSGWSVGSEFFAMAPTSDNPDDAFSMVWYIDFISTVDGPYTEGQVVRLVSADSQSPAGREYSFSKP